MRRLRPSTDGAILAVAVRRRGGGFDAGLPGMMRRQVVETFGEFCSVQGNSSVVPPRRAKNRQPKVCFLGAFCYLHFSTRGHRRLRCSLFTFVTKTIVCNKRKAGTRLQLERRPFNGGGRAGGSRRLALQNSQTSNQYLADHLRLMFADCRNSEYLRSSSSDSFNLFYYLMILQNDGYDRTRCSGSFAVRVTSRSPSLASAARESTRDRISNNQGKKLMHVLTLNRPSRVQ
jgi:hypothetical protein